jgi:hypothetical protein
MIAQHQKQNNQRTLSHVNSTVKASGAHAFAGQLFAVGLI